MCGGRCGDSPSRRRCVPAFHTPQTAATSRRATATTPVWYPTGSPHLSWPRIEHKIASRQESQQHLSNVRADEKLVHHSHEMNRRAISLPNIYGVHVVGGSNAVAPI